MANNERDRFKTGLIGEWLVKIRLNEFGVNTGCVDKDTGTDLVMFWDGKILTGQVKSKRNKFNYQKPRNVDILFNVKIVWNDDGLFLDSSKITWKRLDREGSNFKALNRNSIDEMFRVDNGMDGLF